MLINRSLTKSHNPVLLFIIIIVYYSNSTFGQATLKPGENDTSVLRLADPTIFEYKKLFYLYGTVEGNAGNGFLVYISNDLKKWKLSDKNGGYALMKGDAFGTAGFWAPQVFHHNNKFYMAYTANENIAIAESDHPAGPFKQNVKRSLSSPVKQIDPFVFIEKGKKYLYHVRLTEGNKIFVAEMTDDFSSIKTETLKECITATQGWENTAGSRWPVAEGPSILKNRGLYYLVYSANDFRNPDYAVGYATSTDPLGPWTKYPENPVLDKNLIGYPGPGHGDFLITGSNMFYVFHTHNNELKATPRKTALIKARFMNGNKKGVNTLAIDSLGFYFLHR